MNSIQTKIGALVLSAAGLGTGVSQYDTEQVPAPDLGALTLMLAAETSVRRIDTSTVQAAISGASESLSEQVLPRIAELHSRNRDLATLNSEVAKFHAERVLYEELNGAVATVTCELIEELNSGRQCDLKSDIFIDEFVERSLVQVVRKAEKTNENIDPSVVRAMIDRRIRRGVDVASVCKEYNFTGKAGLMFESVATESRELQNQGVASERNIVERVIEGYCRGISRGLSCEQLSESIAEGIREMIDDAMEPRDCEGDDCGDDCGDSGDSGGSCGGNT